MTRAGNGDAALAPSRSTLARPRKTIVLPWGDRSLRAFVASECPVPADVVEQAPGRLLDSDAAVLVVESVTPAVRRVTRALLAERCTFALLVRRDVWTGEGPGHRLLEEVQANPRRKLIRFWRDRDELERTLREEVFTLDDSILVSKTIADGTQVAPGERFEQTWELENIGFRTWRDRVLAEFSGGCLEPDARRIPLPVTAPGERVRPTMAFTAPPGPATCRSVWKLVDPDGSLALPWAHGVWCEVKVVQPG